MRKEELIKQLQEHEPLLANAVSHMVEYIQDRYPAAYPSKAQTEAVNDYLCKWGRQHVRAEPRTSPYRFAEHHYCRYPCIG